MSRLTFALALLSFGLLVLGVHTMADTSGQPLNTNNIIEEEQLQQQQQQQQQQQKRDIDLMAAGDELTPSMEQQLQQAKRLNRADPTDRMPLIIPEDNTNTIYRYQSVGGSGGSGSGSGTGNTNEWLERVRLAANKQHQKQQQRRQAPNSRFVRALNEFETAGRPPTTDLDGGSEATSGGGNLNTVAQAPMYLVEGQDEEDRDYAFINVRPSSSLVASQQFRSPDNHESAARDSLWTSGQLRDLLIAQERRNRTRKLGKLLRTLARQRAAELSRASSSAGESSRPVEVAEIREKRRRCKVDPNLGVKNLSYCDTDAYFGAADYSMRDVWDSAGRRR